MGQQVSFLTWGIATNIGKKPGQLVDILRTRPLADQTEKTRTKYETR